MINRLSKRKVVLELAVKVVILFPFASPRVLLIPTEKRLATFSP